MMKLAREVARETVPTQAESFADSRNESQVVSGEPSLTEPQMHSRRASAVPLLSHPTDKHTQPRETIRMNSGIIVPATAVVGNSLIFLFSLCATAYLTAGLVRMFPWSNLFVSAVLLFFLTLFLPLTLFSWDWLKGSLAAMASGAEEVITVPRWVGDAAATKRLYRGAFLGVSAACVLLSGVCFYLAVFSTRGTPGVNLFLGWFSVGLAIYSGLVYFDVNRVNSQRPGANP